MAIRVKDFASFIPPECRDLFGDSGGEDRVSLALVDEKAFDDANRRLRFVASDNTVDLHDEIIDPGAFHELRDVYMRNPVILAGHTHRLSTGMSPAMAQAIELATDKSPVIGVAQFGAGEHINQVSLDNWHAYRGGNQRAFSVGFRSRDMEKREDLWVHTKALLLEISGVPVPANSNALVMNYVLGKIAQYGNLHSQDNALRQEVEHMLRELNDRMRSLEEIVSPDAGPADTRGETGTDPNADGDVDENEIAECIRAELAECEKTLGS